MTGTSRPIRVIQWATGAIGKFTIGTCATNDAFELVGCYVHSPEKAGRDAGEIAGIAPLGVEASRDVDTILAIDADVVHYAPLLANVDEMCRILEAGKNVVTPTGFTTVRDEGDRARLEAACQAGGVSFHGSGIHPGFSGDRLPLILSAMSQRIDRIIVYEVIDMSRVNESWDMVEMLGFDMTPEEARKTPPALFEVMSTIFFESIALVAEGLGVDIDHYEKRHEFALAKRDVEIDLELGTKKGTIRQGHVAGQSFDYRGMVGGEAVIDFRTRWKMGDDLEPDWPFYDPWSYRVIIEGEPPLQLKFTCGAEDGKDSAAYGLLCTAMNCLNTIPHLVAATPGIKTQLDLPMIRAVNAFHPGRSRSNR
ncbi:MAG: dihydrodipicolinate reductase [Deltaproteobacteria bacterium]|nr:dihydrodipicolinate reductase [Deltaproteobacteria bacterium]